MKSIILAPIMFFCSLSLIAQDFELQLRQADCLWKINKLDSAISVYKDIIKTIQIPEEYQSLIYLRLSEAQFQAKQLTDCKQTLSAMSSLMILPEHHRLKVDELQKKISNLPIVSRTLIPVYTKVAATFYVSQNASIKGNGSIQKPFKTIDEALKKLQAKINTAGLSEGVLEIVLLGDQYTVSKSVKLDNKMTATNRNPILIRSLTPQNRTVITGGVNITKWKTETDPDILALLPLNARNKVIVANLKENGIFCIDSLVFGGFSSGRRFDKKSIPEFFYKGKIQKMSRWPNNKDTTVILNNFKSDRPLNWEKENDVWLHGYWKWTWADAYEKFKSYDKDTIRLVPPMNTYGFADSTAEYDWMPKSSKFHVLNSLAEMDLQGDYKLSILDGKIWYFPPKDFNPVDCILSVYSLPISLDSCDFVTLKDLEFRFFRGDAIIAKNCENISVLNCKISDVSGDAIQINGGFNHLLHSCTIESMGRGAVILASGDREHLRSSGSVIENCHIRDLSRIDRTYTPALLLEGIGVKIQYCFFEDLPSSAIRLEGNDFLIQLNEFAQCVTESGDQGTIDIFGNLLYRGNVIRWNYFHDIGNGAAGVRLDDAISGFCINENIFLRSSNGSFGGVQIHGGKDNILEGNIFIDGNSMVSQIAWGEKKWKESLTGPGYISSVLLKNNYWKSDSWQMRYPELKKNLLEGHDRNYYIDNLAIKIKVQYQRMSVEPWDTFESGTLNNVYLPGNNAPNTLLDTKKYIVPWHYIPADDIGLNKKRRNKNLKIQLLN